MKKTSRLAIILIIMVICINHKLPAEESPRSCELFNSNWKFIRFFNSSDEKDTTSREAENLQLPSVNDTKWRSVDLPHDWAIEGPFNVSGDNSTGMLPWKGIGWYRKHFSVTDNDKGKRIYVDFEGAMANARVWLNGKFVGEWPYGYTSFRVDLTSYIIFGQENILAVRLNTKDWDSRYYTGAGLYRNVWLIKTSQLHLAYNGVFCTTPEIKKERGILSVNAEVENHINEPVAVSIKASVYKLNDKPEPSSAPVAESSVVTATLSAMKDHDFRLDIPVADPVLWDISDPELYRVAVTVLQGNTVTDRYETNFGFRTLNFTHNDGFILNGKRAEIRGVCNHHDLGALGAAFNIRAAERQLEILREMGCNAIRTSHNPPAPELLDLCDRMGFLVQVEAFDTWRIGKKRRDYNLIFDAWHAEDLKAMVRRDRNHPSVIMWSIGNEVPDQKNPNLATSLRNIVKSEDNTRPVTAGCNNNYTEFEKIVDVFGFQYNPSYYEKFYASEENNNLPVYSTESASTVSSRGEYFFPVVQGDQKNVMKGKGIFQVTSYDVAFPTWATTPDREWTMLDKYPGAMGEFVWTGFDYLGEPYPEPAPARSSYFGIIDLAGFKKDRFFLYQSKWRPELPMAHILPHWNWPDRKGLVTPVHVYTSGDEAELFINGKSLGRKKKGEYEYRLKWDSVVYQPGELKVIAYKNGSKWAEDVMKTTGKASLLSLAADRQSVHPDGTDLIYITVRIEDKNNLLVPGSSNLVNFSIEGPGKIVAVDNGDPTSHDPFQASYRKAFNGLCLVIVKAEKASAGSFILKAESKGLKSATVKISIGN